MNVLHVIASVDPRHGGPQEVLRQYCLGAARIGEHFEVACLDARADGPLARAGVPVHALGPGRTRWCHAPRAQRWLNDHVGDYDAVVVHGLHQYHTLAAWRACRLRGVPYFVVPHGMLGPWFRRARPWHHLRKYLFWPWQDYPLLRDAAAVIFSCEQEGRDAPHTFWPYSANGAVSGFGVAEVGAAGGAGLRALAEAHPALAGRRFLLFLGRLHPVKGCDLLLEAFARIAQRHEDLDLVFAGPAVGTHEQALRARSGRLGLDQRVHWTGGVDGDLKSGLLRAAEALVLPSHHENFGMVIAEALSCGTPVLLSSGVNIWREVVHAGAGLVGAHDVAGIHHLLDQWLSMVELERARMRRAARHAFLQYFTIDEAARRLVSTMAPFVREPAS